MGKPLINIDDNWWQLLPDRIKEDIELSIEEANRGEVITHEEVKRRYVQWFVK